MFCAMFCTGFCGGLPDGPSRPSKSSSTPASSGRPWSLLPAKGRSGSSKAPSLRNSSPALCRPGVATAMNTVRWAALATPLVCACRARPSAGGPKTMRGHAAGGGSKSASKHDTHSSASTAPSASRRAASKASGWWSSPSGLRRLRSGRPESQVNTWLTVASPSPPPSHSAAARVCWFSRSTMRCTAATTRPPCRGRSAGAPTITL